MSQRSVTDGEALRLLADPETALTRGAAAPGGGERESVPRAAPSREQSACRGW